MGKLWALLLLLASSQAHAGDFFYKYGVGIFRSADYGFGETKFASLGLQGNVSGPMIWQLEGGGFFDNAGPGSGRGSSAFGNFSMGLEARPGYFFIQSLWGVGGITHPDAMLGGPFEFNQDLIIGVKDFWGVGFALDYKHMSSAGIYNPNVGRDGLLLRASVRLW